MRGWPIGVDAAMDRVEPADGDAVIDGAIAKAEPNQLLARDHPVLP